MSLKKMKTTDSITHGKMTARRKKITPKENRKSAFRSVKTGIMSGVIAPVAVVENSESPFKPIGMERVIKPSPVIPSVGVKRIQEAVDAVVNKHH